MKIIDIIHAKYAKETSNDWKSSSIDIELDSGFEKITGVHLWRTVSKCTKLVICAIICASLSIWTASVALYTYSSMMVVLTGGLYAAIAWLLVSVIAEKANQDF